MVKIKKIISGGQTGADRAALDLAIRVGIPHGGWIPRGRKTEAGSLPLRYQLQEMLSSRYVDRTEQNVIDSDGTLIFSHGPLAGGSALTRRLAKRHGKPWLHLDLHRMTAMKAAYAVVEWLDEDKVEVLNVAGPRASRDPQIYDDVKAVLEVVVKLLEIEEPRNGGQDESKYALAIEVVTQWVDEMIRSGFRRREALETLLLVLRSGALAAVHEQVREYETEIEAVLKSQLGQTH